jgi:hypothetical protein
MPDKQIWELNPATVNTNTDVIPKTLYSSGDAEKLTLAKAFYAGAVQPDETTKTDLTIQSANNTVGAGGDILLKVGSGTTGNNYGSVVIQKIGVSANGQDLLTIKRGSAAVARIDDNSCMVIGVNNVVPEAGTSNGSAIMGQNNSPQQQIVSTVITGSQNTIGAEYSLIAGYGNYNESTGFLTSSIIAGYNNSTSDLTNVHVFILGDSNVASSGPGIEDTYVVGSANRVAGCGWAIGTSNAVAGNQYPCAYAIGYNQKAYDGGFSYGTNNITYGQIGNSGQAAFNYGYDNECIGSNNSAFGYNNSVGRYNNATLISGDTFYLDTPLDLTSWFSGVGTKVALSYLNNKGTRTVEWLTFSNVTYNSVDNRTEFDLTARSMTANALPAYQVGFADTSESFALGYGNQIYASSSTSTLGRGNVLNSCANVHAFGYAINRTNYTNSVFVGGDATLYLQSTTYNRNEGMAVNPVSTYTTSLTSDVNGNLALSNSALNRTIVTINQTSNIDVNSITYFGPISSTTNGQNFRLVNIGTSDITFHKDNVSGTAGYRIYWNKAGGSLVLSQNQSVMLYYIDNLPLSGSTGGWLLIPDGHA